jgi:hypothetical protein
MYDYVGRSLTAYSGSPYALGLEADIASAGDLARALDPEFTALLADFQRKFDDRARAKITTVAPEKAAERQVYSTADRREEVRAFGGKGFPSGPTSDFSLRREAKGTTD